MRCQNINRKPKRKGCEDSSEQKQKRSKQDCSEKHACPSLVGEVEDETSHTRNVELLKDQLTKARVDHKSVQMLMKRTFTRRRKSILDEPTLVVYIVEEYPVFKKPSFVCVITCINCMSNLRVGCI